MFGIVIPSLDRVTCPRSNLKSLLVPTIKHHSQATWQKRLTQKSKKKKKVENVLCLLRPTHPHPFIIISIAKKLLQQKSLPIFSLRTFIFIFTCMFDVHRRYLANYNFYFVVYVTPSLLFQTNFFLSWQGKTFHNCDKLL